MRIFLFTKREDCKVFLCLEDLISTKKVEFYLYEEPKEIELLPHLNQGKSSLIIIDYTSYEEKSLEILKNLKNLVPQAYIVITNAPEDVNLAVTFLKEGAYHYLTQDPEKECLCKLLNEVTLKEKKADLSEFEPLNLFVGKSKAILRIKKILPTIAETHCSVLITGETGTGKELLARIIHQLSPRAKGPFIILDCTTLQETIFESEVFGYEKGAFTGAYTSKKGLVELADGGTLFIDEIGELPLVLQKKFLRFLQEKTFMRVGGTRFYKADARVIAATNRNLEEEVMKGNFRADLYFRLNTLIIEIPPLRERKEDIPLLLDHFIKLKSQELGRPFKGFSKAFFEALMDYDWPGNVRELINVVERALILAPDGYLTENLLPKSLLEKNNKKENTEEKNKISETELQQIHSQNFNLKEVEKELILKALKMHNWNQTRTAEYLGISRKQLINKMKKYGLRKEKDKINLKS